MTETPHRFHPGILRAYDVRGIVGQTLNGDDAHALGRAFGIRVCQAQNNRDGGKKAGSKRVCVGYDGRLTSPELVAALIDGLCGVGLDVLNIGLVPTPVLYFSVFSNDADGGVMVTGSHNPPDHNGFKMVLGKKPFFGDDIANLEAVLRDHVPSKTTPGMGQAVEVDTVPAYLTRIRADFQPGRPLKVAWDAGNGAAGAVMSALTQHLPGDHILLCADIDGRFPNHHPDPSVPENLTLLRQTVREKNCDIGIAFDGDGDRIGVVDNEGEIVWPDQLMILWARALLADNPGATIIADVKASQTLFDEISRLGGKPMMSRTGHSLIKDMMVRTGALLAGEMSGHVFFSDRYYGFDDGLYAAVRLLSILSGQSRSLASLRRELPVAVNTPELRFPCPAEDKFTVVERITETLRQDGAVMETIDGVRVREDSGWWLLRASNTQEVLVARCEAQTQADLTRIKRELAARLSHAGIAIPKGILEA